MENKIENPHIENLVEKMQRVADAILRGEKKILSENSKLKVPSSLLASLITITVCVAEDLSVGIESTQAKMRGGVNICPLIKPIEQKIKKALDERQELYKRIEDGNFVGKQEEDSEEVKQKKERQELLLEQEISLEENNSFLLELLDIASGKKHGKSITKKDLVEIRANYALGMSKVLKDFQFSNNVENGRTKYIKSEGIINDTIEIQKETQKIFQEEVERRELSDKDLVKRNIELLIGRIFEVIEGELRGYFGSLEDKNKLENSMIAELNLFRRDVRKLLFDYKNVDGSVNVNDFIEKFNSLLDGLKERLNKKAGLTVDFTSCHIALQEEAVVSENILSDQVEEEEIEQLDVEDSSNFLEEKKSKQENTGTLEKETFIKRQLLKKISAEQVRIKRICQIYNESRGEYNQIYPGDFIMKVITNVKLDGVEKTLRFKYSNKSDENISGRYDKENDDSVSLIVTTLLKYEELDLENIKFYSLIDTNRVQSDHGVTYIDDEGKVVNDEVMRDAYNGSKL